MLNLEVCCLINYLSSHPLSDYYAGNYQEVDKET